MNRANSATLATLLCLALPCLAAATVAGGHGLVVTGEVTADGRPLAGAEVRLVPLAAAPADDGGDDDPAVARFRTRADGRFAFSLSEPGPWAFEVTAPGRLPMRAVVEVLEDHRLAAVELPPARRLDLRLHAEGRPLPGAAAAWPASRARTAAPFGAWRARATIAHADEAGRVSLPVPVREAGEIRVAAAGLTPALLAVAESPGPHAVELVPAGGDESDEVEVVDGAGRPLPGARLAEPTAALPLAVTDPRGRALLPLGDEPGRALALTTADGRQGSAEGPADPGARADGAPLRFRFLPHPALTGRVVDAATGEPLAGARVWSRPPAALAVATTGADGSFTLHPGSGPPPRTLAAAAPGHRAARAELADGRPVSLALLAHRRGRGRVVDAEERPVAGAEVRLTGLPQGDGGEPRRALGPFLSGADGRFEVPDPPPGRYRLSVRAEGFGPVTVPGLVVDEGPTSDLGTVTLVPGVALDGRVVDDEGRPVAGAGVSLADAGPLPWPVVLSRGEVRQRAVSDDDGRFALRDLEAGATVRLRVEKDGYSPTAVGPVALPAEEPIEVALDRAATLAGWVVDEAGHGVAGALVGAASERGGGGERSAFTGDDGRFELAGLAAGRWTIDASAAGYRAARPSDVVVEPGGEAGDVEITLEAGAALAGRVVEADGSPAGGVGVELTGEAGATSLVGRSDAGGRFRFTGLAPGAYRLAASDEGRRSERRVDVAGDADGLLLALPAGAEVAGTVERADGAPVAGAEALLVRGDGGSARARSDQAGRFAWRDVPDGLHHLVVRAAGLAPSPAIPVRVDGAPVRGLEVVLDAGVTLRGRVSGVDFRDLPAVVVRAAGAGGGVTGVGPQGDFVLPDLPAGELAVTAELPGTGRGATRHVVLPPGAREVEVELVLP